MIVRILLLLLNLFFVIAQAHFALAGSVLSYVASCANAFCCGLMAADIMRALMFGDEL